MSDQIYAEALKNIQRRLRQPIVLSVHALLFGVLSSVGGFISLARLESQIDGRLYWVIFLWSVILCLHGVYAYLGSGARKNSRENAIREELIKLAYANDLDADELVDLHRRLSDDIRQRSAPFNPTVMATTTYPVLWIGMLLAGLLIFGTGGDDVSILPILLIIQGIPLAATAGVTVLLAITYLIGWFTHEDTEARTENIRTMYVKKSEKNKRLASERLTIDDEGEIVEVLDFAPRQDKQR